MPTTDRATSNPATPNRATLTSRASATYLQRRQSSELFDHVIRTGERYVEVRVHLFAGAVTYYAFLSLFPLLALAYALVSYLVVYFPGVEQLVTDLLTDLVPVELLGDGGLDVENLTSAKTTALGLGLLGLLYAGLGWVGAMRHSMRTVFGAGRDMRSFPVAKLADLFTLCLLAVAVLVSTLLTGLVGGYANTVLNWVQSAGSEDPSQSLSGLVVLLTQVLALALSITVTWVALMVTLTRLDGRSLPASTMVSAAVIGAFGIEILRYAGVWYVERATSNPIFGVFAVVVGILIWLMLLSQTALTAACWASTTAAARRDALDNPESVYFDNAPATG